MIVINNIDSQRFSFNGVEYYKNFTPIVIGDKIRILNTYDSSIELTDSPRLYSEFSVNDLVFDNVASLQSYLLPIVFSRLSLNGDFLSNNISTYEEATTPIADTDQLFVIQGGVVKKVDKSEIGGASSPIWTGQINSKITHTGTTNITAMASIDIPSNININNNRTIIEIDTFAIASTIVTNANFVSYITINQDAVYNASERVATYNTSVTALPREMSLNRRVICLGGGDVSSQYQYSSLSDFDAGNNYRRVESNFLTDDKKKITVYLKLDNASNTAVFYGMLVKIYQTP
jgi:hypothetical protein